MRYLPLTLALLCILWGSWFLGQSRAIGGVSVRDCKVGVIGYLAESEGSFYLTDTPKSESWDDVVCGLSAGQLVQAMGVDKEM